MEEICLFSFVDAKLFLSFRALSFIRFLALFLQMKQVYFDFESPVSETYR